MDVSKVTESVFKGLEIDLHRFAGVRALRVVHPDVQTISEHRHDWTYIGLHALGRYREVYDGGVADMSGPSAVLHPAGRPHADLVGAEGLETVTIEFDSTWLRLHGFDHPLDRSRVWRGGAVALAARRLARAIRSARATEADLGRATATFLHAAFAAKAKPDFNWLELVENELAQLRPTIAIARRLDLHPAWLARAYRAATGEGLHETARRKRVERACGLLRRTRQPLAEIALASGFCDQGHMNRCFRAVVGRTPLAVRGERTAMLAEETALKNPA